jgi:hypothetical protein
MNIKSFLLLVHLAFLGHVTAVAQSGGFCDVVNTILKESDSKFKGIQGKMMEMNATATMWASTVKLPGSIGYRIVNSMGFFYESAVLQTTNRSEIKPIYDEYKKKLAECLSPQGYEISYQENFIAGLSDYKKVVYMKKVKEDTPLEELPPHITMEVTYSKEVGKFTVVIFLFQH